MQETVYLDNAATTPVRREVLEAMLPYLSEERFGNPSSPHRLGRDAQAGVDQARQRIAGAMGVEPGQVIFTSGGTEADNLAVIGAALNAREQGRPFRVAVSAIEHKAVLQAAHWIGSQGGEEIILPVTSDGTLDQDAVDAALHSGLAVLSAMWVNNEIGVIQDVETLAMKCRRRGVPFHTDAVQAVGKVACDLHRVNATFVSISGHKIGAPKGIGALIVRDRQALSSLLHGGKQQYGLRPGTENVPGIVGLGVAVELAVSEVGVVSEEVRRLRDDFEARLIAAVPDIRANCSGSLRAPHISNICVAGADGSVLTMHLDLAGIACSSGSACSSAVSDPSHVLTALGHTPEEAGSSLRFSFSKNNSPRDVDYVVSRMPEVVQKVRQLSELLSE